MSIPWHEATIAWPDPAAGAANVGMDGLAWLQAARDGHQPIDPFPAALGLRVRAVEVGAVTVTIAVAQWQTNLAGIAHGGFLSSVLDQACGMAVKSTLAAGRSAVHITANYRFLRPVVESAELTAVASVLHTAEEVITTRGEIRAGDRTAMTCEATHALIVTGQFRTPPPSLSSSP